MSVQLKTSQLWYFKLTIASKNEICRMYIIICWPLKEEDARRLERNEMWMERRMCGAKLSDRKRSEYLRSRLGIECMVEVVRRVRLLWFGHMERMVGEDWVSACRKVKVEEKGCRG